MIDLPASLAERLREHKIRTPHSHPGDFVFTARTGGPLEHRNVAQRGLARAVERAIAVGNVDGSKRVPTFHELRHAHASALELALVARRALDRLPRRSVTRSRRVGAECWYAWLSRDSGPGGDHFLLDRDAFERAEFRGLPDLDELMDTSVEAESGANWTLRLWHRGLVTEVLSYV